MSRRLVVTQYISIDGVVEDPVGMEGSGLGDWTGPFSRGPEGDRFKIEELFASDTLLFGRKTFDGFAAVWPTIKDETGMADRFNSMNKYVVSTSLKNANWNNTKILREDFVDHVKDMKRKNGGYILIYGSLSLMAPLAVQNLIDEYSLMIYPVILGRGKRLFPDGVHSSLRLIENKLLGTGIVLSRYEIAR
jgi:dihydrofolate reductase